MNHGIRRHGGRRAPKALVWTGTVSFGLVNIPVTMHSGESANELRFTMLDRRDLSPIGYRKINKSTGSEVPSDKIVKAYRLEDDRFAPVSVPIAWEELKPSLRSDHFNARSVPRRLTRGPDPWRGYERARRELPR